MLSMGSSSNVKAISDRGGEATSIVETTIKWSTKGATSTIWLSN